MNSVSDRGLAVITGAAGGLGSSFAHKLAEQGYRLLLVDRRQAPLDQVSGTLAEQHGVSVEPHVADLSKREEVGRLARRLQHGPEVSLLVNNAGFGTLDYFVDTDPQFLVGMADVHVIAPTILTRAVLPGMIERDCGAVINVSSLGAWFPSAGNAQYGATKTYLAVFTQALQEELRGTNVRVQALCPGFVRTEFHATEGMKGFQHCAPAERFWQSADQVVECSLRALYRRQVLVTPGLAYGIVGRLARMPLLQPLMQRITRVPRLAPSTVETAASRLRPAYGIARRA